MDNMKLLASRNFEIICTLSQKRKVEKSVFQLSVYEFKIAFFQIIQKNPIKQHITFYLNILLHLSNKKQSFSRRCRHTNTHAHIQIYAGNPDLIKILFHYFCMNAGKALYAVIVCKLFYRHILYIYILYVFDKKFLYFLI